MSQLSEALERQLRKIKPVPPTSPVVAVPVAPVPVKVSPSDKQIDFFKSLVARKQLTDAQRTQLTDSLQVLDKRAISSTIQWLVGLPWMPRPAVTSQTQGPRNPSTNAKIDQGCYAVVDPADGVLKFYQVRRPTEGKWAGYVFLSQVSGENHIPMRDRKQRDPIYAEIEKDVIGALRRFGKEIGQCGHCRKQLTDQESREFGIGPVCRKALGI